MNIWHFNNIYSWSFRLIVVIMINVAPWAITSLVFILRYDRVSVKKKIIFHINSTLCIFNQLLIVICIFFKMKTALWLISIVQVVLRKLFKKCRYSFKINTFTYLDYKPVKPLRSQLWSTRACALFLKEPGFGWSRDFRCHHVL